MTILTEEKRKAQMDDMKSFDEPMPAVGIFWYDPKDHTLFGVRKKEITPRDLPYFEFVYDEHWDLGHVWSGDMPAIR